MTSTSTVQYLHTVCKLVLDAFSVQANVSSSVLLFVGFEDVYTPAAPPKLITKDTVNVCSPNKKPQTYK